METLIHLDTHVVVRLYMTWPRRASPLVRCPEIRLTACIRSALQPELFAKRELQSRFA